MTTRLATGRIWLATAGLAGLFGCGNANPFGKDDAASGIGARGVRASVTALTEVIAPERAKFDVEAAYEFVAEQHGFRAAGMSEQDMWDVVSFIGAVKSGVDEWGEEPIDRDHPGIQTFEESCAQCHNSPDPIDVIADARQSVGNAPPVIVDP
jgi:hypothetical protein